MSKTPNTRKRLDQRVDDLHAETKAAFRSVGWNLNQDRHDFTRMAEIHAGIDHALLLQTQARHLDWRIERLARGVRYWSSPWWRRALLRMGGRAVERWVVA